MQFVYFQCSCFFWRIAVRGIYSIVIYFCKENIFIYFCCTQCKICQFFLLYYFFCSRDWMRGGFDELVWWRGISRIGCFTDGFRFKWYLHSAIVLHIFLLALLGVTPCNLVIYAVVYIQFLYIPHCVLKGSPFENGKSIDVPFSALSNINNFSLYTKR